jgi:hypothetical protein
MNIHPNFYLRYYTVEIAAEEAAAKVRGRRGEEIKNGC